MNKLGMIISCPRKCLGDATIKLGITLLVCIALCYSCFLVENHRGETTAKTLQQGKSQNEKFTQLKQPVAHNEHTPLGLSSATQRTEGDVEGSGSVLDSEETKQQRQTQVTISDNIILESKVSEEPTLLDYTPISEKPLPTEQPGYEDEPQYFKRFLESDYTLVDNPQNDIFKFIEGHENVFGPHSETVEVSDEYFLSNEWNGQREQNAPATKTANSAEERYFPVDAYFESDLVGKGEESEEFIVTDFDTGDFMQLEESAPIPAISAVTTGWEGMLESLFGRMARFITPSIQQQTRHGPYIQRDNTIRQTTNNFANWIKKFNC